MILEVVIAFLVGGIIGGGAMFFIFDNNAKKFSALADKINLTIDTKIDPLIEDVRKDITTKVNKVLAEVKKQNVEPVKTTAKATTAKKVVAKK